MGMDYVLTYVFGGLAIAIIVEILKSSTIWLLDKFKSLVKRHKNKKGSHLPK